MFMLHISPLFILYYNVMQPKHKATGRATRLPSKHAQGATSTCYNSQLARHPSAEIALSTATLEQLQLLSASSLCLHLKAHSLPSMGNKPAMVSRLYN